MSRRVTLSSMRRWPLRVALLSAAAVALAGCGLGVHNTAAEPTGSASPSNFLLPLHENPAFTGGTTATAAPVAKSKLLGSGAYIYNAGGVYATVTVPAPYTDTTARSVKDYVRRIRAAQLQLVEVTVTNHGGTAFPLSGFRLSTTSGTAITLLPVVQYLSAYLRGVSIIDNADLFNQGTDLVSSLIDSIPPGASATGLVATDLTIPGIAGLSYTPAGGTTVALVRKSVLVHQQQVAAKKAAALAAAQQKAALNAARRKAARAAARPTPRPSPSR